MIEKSKLLQGRFEVFIFPFSQGIFKRKKGRPLKNKPKASEEYSAFSIYYHKRENGVEEAEALNAVFQTSTG